MERWQGKVAVVTGASAGIGAAISENLVKAGITVVGLARRKVKLQIFARQLNAKSKTPKFHYCVADVSKEQEILEAFQWIKENVGPVSILVNNAGILRVASLIDGEPHHWKDIFETNVIGLCVVTREAIRDMKTNGIDGHIIHINSGLGHTVAPMPNFGVYPSSKFAVTALTQTLKHELAAENSKIKVSSISPSSVETEIYVASSKASEVELPKNAPAIPKLSVRDVADAVSYALSTPATVQIHDILLGAN